ncbi:MAG: tripartite tricarboxylate transporter substrate binding protein [Desulfobacterales bacterium]|nr:tripartite tricarboxylate transporter substrate binding protein [Desulfobacterales bacterium]
MKKLSISLLVLLALAVSFTCTPAMAAWPKKPVKIMIPWPAGNDPSTMVATSMAPLMAKELGVPVKVVNKPGGGAVLATNELKNSRPDGYTMGLISIGPMITQVLRGKTPYKNQDLKPLGLIWSSPFTLACRADAPYNNLAELAEYAKTHELRLAHWGLGAVPTLIAMNAAKKGGFKWKETAYKQLNPLLVVKGDADVITFSTPALKDYVDAGKMKILAAMVPERLPEYPNVPTVAEQGFGDAYSIWFGAFVPAKTKDEVAQKLSQTFFKVMAMPEIQQVIKNVGVIPHPTLSDLAREQMDNELANFGAIMKDLGIIQ